MDVFFGRKTVLDADLINSTVIAPRKSVLNNKVNL